MVPTVVINYSAVLVAAIISMILGIVWYSPALFGRSWMQSAGLSRADVARAKKKGMTRAYVLAFIGSLVMSFVLAHLIRYTTATTLTDGFQTGFWVWLGFATPLLLGSTLWEGRPWKFYLINSAYYLLSLLVMGGLLALWQ